LSLETALLETGKMARALGRQHHWRLARAFAPSVTDSMLKGWFKDVFMEGERLPKCPRRRMLWLVEVRAAFRARHDSLATLMVSAAVVREAERLRLLKRRSKRGR
jgi:hypothetical protein